MAVCCMFRLLTVLCQSEVRHLDRVHCYVERSVIGGCPSLRIIHVALYEYG